MTSVRTVAEVAPGRWLLELSPHTGRMHQLRVQAAARGMPVVGDALYGGPPLHDESDPDPRRQPIALHALRLRFHDPDSAEEIVVSAGLPHVWPAATGALVKGI